MRQSKLVEQGSLSLCRRIYSELIYNRLAFPLGKMKIPNFISPHCNFQLKFVSAWQSLKILAIALHKKTFKNSALGNKFDFKKPFRIVLYHTLLNYCVQVYEFIRNKVSSLIVVFFLRKHVNI